MSNVSERSSPMVLKAKNIQSNVQEETPAALSATSAGMQTRVSVEVQHFPKGMIFDPKSSGYSKNLVDIMKKAVKIENFIDEKLEKQSEVRDSLRLDRKKWIEKNENSGDFAVDSDSGSYLSEKDLIGVLKIEKVPDLENESSKQEKESQKTLQ